MGIFDFFSVKAVNKSAKLDKSESDKNADNRGACGTVKIDRFSFPVTDFNSKGFIVEPYDKDILIPKQRFRFEINVAKGNQTMKGTAEALVMKIKDEKLAAAFTIKPYGH